MKDCKKPSIGLIGLGIIGSRVAVQLRQAEYPVFVWNRTPRSEPNFLPSPAKIAETADIIQIFVRDGGALREVIHAMGDALTSTHILLNHATISPQEALEAAELVAKQGAQFLHIPFTGSRDAAAAGKLVYFVGGDSEVSKSITPILEVSSEKVLMMGSLEAAAYIKIATNMIIGTQVEILAEALEFLNLGNIPLSRLGEALQYSAANSGTIAMKLPQMLEGDFEARFSAKNILKDMQFSLAIGQQNEVELPAAKAVAEVYHRVVESGLGDADLSAVASQYDYPGKERLLFPLEAPTSLKKSSNPKNQTSRGKKSWFSFFKKRR